MGLLTKDEEKRFPKEREVLAIESSEDTNEEDNVQAEEPPRRTARGPVQMDVVATREQPESRSAKRHNLIADSGEGQRPKSWMVETHVIEIRMLRIRAKLKKKANRMRVVSDSLDSSVAKSDAAASMTDEEKREEPTIQVIVGSFESIGRSLDGRTSRTFGGRVGDSKSNSTTFGADAVNGD